MGYVNPRDNVAGIRMLIHDSVAEHAGPGNAAGDINGRTDGPLMQIGFAARQTGRQTNHGHDGITQEHDNADIRNAQVTDCLKDGIVLDTVLDKRLIRIAAKAVLAAQDVRHVVTQFRHGHDFAIDQMKSIAAPAATISHHEDAITAATMGRLHDETIVLCQGDR